MYLLEIATIQTFCDTYLPIRSDFDGCMYGLRPIYHKGDVYIRKPWSIRTNHAGIAAALSKKCDGSHVHVRCEGRETKGTEQYTDMIVDAVHDAFSLSSHHCTH